MSLFRMSLKALGVFICMISLSLAAQPVIGVAKNDIRQGRNVTLDFYLENLGTEALNNIALSDDLDAVFGAGNYLFILTPFFTDDPGTLNLNAAYDGSSNDALITGGSLAIGETAQIRFEIELVAITDQGLGMGIYSNQVTATGEGADSFRFVSDLSDDGTDPDPNENGDPGDEGEDDPTIINFISSTETPVIGVAKSASVSGMDVTLDFYIENYGDVALSSLSLPDDLDRVFGFGNYAVSSAPVLLDDPGTITLNGFFDGSLESDLISSGSLGLGETARIQMVVTVTTVTDVGMGEGVYQNRVSVSGTSPGGAVATDESDNGVNPDPNGNGIPNEDGENDPTPIILGEEPVIGVATTATQAGNNVVLDFYLENLGDVNLSNLSLVNELDSVFGRGNYFVSSQPSFIDDPGTITLNSSYDGNESANLIAAGSLGLGDTAHLQVSVNVFLSDQGLGFGTYTYWAIASGDAPSGGTALDYSDDGTDPDPDGDGSPNGPGEDDPTTFTLSENAVVGIAKSSVVNVNGTTVNLKFYLENYGNVAVGDLSIPDDLDGVFGAGNYVVSARSASGGSLFVNNSYNGSSNTNLLNAGSSLGVGETGQIDITVLVFTLTDQGYGIGTYQNQVTVSGVSPSLAVVSDLSDEGSNPDSDGDGDPSGESEGDPTIIRFGQDIGGAIDAAVSANQVTLDFYLENFGGSNLDQLSFSANLAQMFGDNYFILSSPAFVDDPGTIFLNGAYDGGKNDELLGAGSALGALDTAHIRMEVLVTKVSNQGNGLGVYVTQSTVSAYRGGVLTFDQTVAGSDPDPNGDGNPAENGFTQATVQHDAVVGAALDISRSGTQVTFDYYLENFGTESASGLTMPQSLDDVFGAGNYAILSSPVIVGAASGLVLDAAFDGSENTEIMGAGSGLLAGAVARVQMVVDVTHIVDQGLGVAVYEAQTVVTASDPSGVQICDLSDDGVEPDADGDGDPTAQGLEDPPVPGENDPSVFIVGDSSIGLAQNASVSNGEVILDIYIENLGDVALDSIGIVYPLFTILGFGNYTITTAPYLVSGPATIAPIASYDGTFQQTLLTGGLLQPGELAVIRFALTANPGTYSLQANVTSFDPKDASITDLSDNGVEPDADGDGDGNEAGENDPTLVVTGEDAILGVAKSASISADVVTFDFYLENLGDVALTGLSVPENLDAVLGAGNYTVSGLTVISGKDLFVNPSYDGSLNSDMLSSSSSLSAGANGQIQLAVTVNALADMGLGYGFYRNQVAAFGTGPSGQLASDLSDDGTDPDANGNGDPGDSGEGDPTEFNFSNEIVGIAMAATVSQSEVVLDIAVENLGPSSLDNAFVNLNLDSVFGAGNYEITNIVPRNVAVNSNYDGSSDTELVSGETIALRAVVGAEITVRLITLIDTGAGVGSYSAQASVSSDEAFDLSDDGENPDPDGDGNPSGPGEDDPTLFVVTGNPVIGVAKDVFIDGSLIYLDFYLENLGTVELGNLVMADDLDTVFGPGNYTIDQAPSFIQDPGSLSLNGAFDGSSDTALLAGGVLASLDSAVIRVGVNLITLSDQGYGEGIYYNQVTASGSGPGGATTDDSDFGVDPDPNGNGDPTEEGENDPTPVLPNGGVDTDGDGIDDLIDPDDDNDGVLDGEDNCPLVFNPDQKDEDEDGKGDVCDMDVEGLPVPIGAVVATTGDLLFNSRSRVDSFDSCLGAYGGANMGVNGNVVAGGSITVKNNALITGAQTANTPSDDTPFSGYESLTNEGDLRLTGTLTLPAGDYLFDNVTIESNASLVGSGGVVRIWFNGNLIVKSNGRIDSSGGYGFNMGLFSTDFSGSVELNSNSHVEALIYAPNIPVAIRSNAHLYGAVVGQSVDMFSNSNVHYDEALEAASCPEPEPTSGPVIMGALESTGGDILLQNRAAVDSFTTCSGAYGAGNMLSNGDVRSSRAIILRGNAAIHGAQSPNTPSAAAAPGPPAGVNPTGDLNVNSNTTLAAGDYLYHNINISSNRLLTTDGPVRIWFTGDLNIQSNATVQGLGQSGNLWFFDMGQNGNSHINSNSHVQAVVYTPALNVTVQSNAEFFGAIVGKTITIQSDADIHFDEHLMSPCTRSDR